MHRISIAALVACLALPGCSDDAPSSAEPLPLDEIRARAEELRAELIAVRRDLHMYPELPGEEVRTASVVATRLRALGLEVRTGVGGHGVVAVLRGARPGPVVGFRADMDAMPDTEPPGRAYGSTVPGKFHICGHDLHTTVGLGIAEVLASLRDRMHGTVVFLFQPAEETLAGAAAMLADGALDPRPEVIYAVHAGPFPVGSIAYGAALAGHDSFQIQLTGPNASAALAQQIAGALAPIGTTRPPSDLAGIDELIDGIQRPDGPYATSIYLRARAVTDRDPIAVAGSIKASNDELFAPTRAEIEQVAEQEAGPGNYELRFDPGPFPSMHGDPDVTAQTLPALTAAIGDANALPLHAALPFASEDFALLLREVPGAMFFLGVADRSRGLIGFSHFPDFDIDERSIEVGTTAMSAVIWERLAKRSPR